MGPAGRGVLLRWREVGGVWKGPRVQGQVLGEARSTVGGEGVSEWQEGWRTVGRVILGV